MYVLGINGGVRMGYQDISATLMKDGKVIAAMEEERCNRIKHSAGQIPYLSVIEVLKIGRISIRDIDLIVSHGSTWGDQYEHVLEEYFKRCFGHCPKLMRVHHHMAHAASAYYASGFNEAMILTMDASGDGIALQKAVGKGSEIVMKEQIPRTNSLGIFYAMMTQFCGFTRDTDEYKLMGLAPYGNANKIDLSNILKIGNSDYEFVADYIKKLEAGMAQPTKQQAIYSRKLEKELGMPRLPGSELTEFYKDVAAATQERLTEAIITVVKSMYKEYGLTKICLAGGVALNCATNRFIRELDFIDDVYIQPAAGDSGISIGAAYLGAKELGDTPLPMTDAYLGNEFSNDEIKDILNLTGVKYQKVSNPEKEAAKLVASDNVIGWFQGRMEFGPRALGNRSILANPLAKDMKRIINAKIKFRESFRPFCPSVLENDFKSNFVGKGNSAPYMTMNYEVVEGGELTSTTHVDNTARVQTVNEDQNRLYNSYLKELKQEIGYGVSINTSFNRNKEPIVNTPIEAVSAFYGSGMDALIIGNYLLKK